MIGAVRSVVGLAAGGVMLAQLTPLAGTALDRVGQMTLDAALIIAVGVLWRALGQKDERIEEKDKQVVAMATKVTEVMVSVMEAVKELRTTVAAQKFAFEDLPCSIREQSQNRR